MNIYDKGDVVRVTATFKVSGTPTDPTTVKFDFKTPAGVTTTYTYGTDSQLVKDSTGVYHVDLDLTQVGVWQYHFYSTGTAKASAEAALAARAGAF